MKVVGANLRRISAAVLCCLTIGCCYTPSENHPLADPAPLPRDGKFTGLYEDYSVEAHESLWQLLGGKRTDDKSQPLPLNTKIRISDDDRGIVTAALLDKKGNTIGRPLSLKRAGGYAVMHHPSFSSIILVTNVYCYSDVIGAEPNRDLRVFTSANSIFFITVIPVFPDTFTRRRTFHRIGD